MAAGVRWLQGLLLLAGVCALESCSTDSSLFSTGKPGGAKEETDLPTTTGSMPQTTAASSPAPGDSYEVVTLLWGTNRAPSSAPTPEGKQLRVEVAARPFYGAARAEKIALGVAKVTVPKIARPVGQVTRPRTVTLLNVELYSEKEDPRKHFTIRELQAVPQETFLKVAGEQTKEAVNFRGQALIFVHGFNTGFDDALYRAAQITYDIGFDGASYVFSWPSKGDASGYLHDRDSVDYSIKQFTEFVQMVARKTGAKQVNILAHSMGARVVIDALLPAQGKAGPVAIGNLKQVILVAADADRTVFEQRAQQHKKITEALTLYANDRDAALVASKRFAGGVPRVGGIADGIPTIVEGSDTIDMSEATVGETTDWVFLGWHHNTYASARHILRDIGLLLRQGTRPPEKRSPVTYRPVDTEHGRFWKYVSN